MAFETGSAPLGAHAVPGTDLATNPAGAISVERARAARAANPIRSRAERLLAVRTGEAWLRETANSERKVGIDLERLGPPWRVLHSVPVGADRSVISHLVIGPTGVFTLTTRAYGSGRPGMLPDRVEAQVSRDSIRVQGETLPYLAEARAQAWRTARTLSTAAGQRVFVRPAVVLVGVDDVRYVEVPERVDVLARRQLLRWLQRFPTVQDTADVERLFALARRGDAWAIAAGH